MDVHAYIAERVEAVDCRLDALLPPDDGSPLPGAMRHLVFPGGKRLRPAFAMAAAEAVGGAAEVAMPVAAAVELIHTYSLVHDDLPCMDDDAERRGRPAVHIQYGEAVAVLAGDALQALAFQSLADTESGGASDGERAARALAVVRDLAIAAGSGHLVGGQVDDLSFDPDNRDAEAIEGVHARKSAALIAASIAGGARLAGASEEWVEALARFGFEVGVAFQIADDVLDEGEDDSCSLVRAVGVEAARERAEVLLAAALERVEGLGDRAEPLRELARLAVRRNT